MLSNNFIGFDETKEFLPKDFDEFNSTKRLRQLFLNLRAACKFHHHKLVNL